MSSGVTFTSKPEAAEYVERKFLEGYECEMKKVDDSEWKVYVLGKRRNDAMTLYATREMERLSDKKYAGDINNLYSEMSQVAKPIRTEADIENEARRKMRNADVKEIKIIVSSGAIGEPTADAAVILGKDGTPELLVIHPVHQYTNDGYFDEVLGHEINHIKEMQ
jgi:hypothetical protein